MIAVLCPCGKEFEVHNYRQETAKYCSKLCLHKFHPRQQKNLSPLLCPCGTTFYVWNYKTNGRTKYCSKKCLASYGLKRGNEHYNWKGGITPVNDKIRRSKEYKRWRLAVLKRDNYTCVLCGDSSKELNVDHIKKFADFPELRLDLNNGRTLCVDCHRKTPTWGVGKG